VQKYITQVLGTFKVERDVDLNPHSLCYLAGARGICKVEALMIEMVISNTSGMECFPSYIRAVFETRAVNGRRMNIFRPHINRVRIASCY
jgi:hypothetical protein